MFIYIGFTRLFTSCSFYVPLINKYWPYYIFFLRIGAGVVSMLYIMPAELRLYTIPKTTKISSMLQFLSFSLADMSLSSEEHLLYATDFVRISVIAVTSTERHVNFRNLNCMERGEAIWERPQHDNNRVEIKISIKVHRAHIVGRICYICANILFSPTLYWSWKTWWNKVERIPISLISYCSNSSNLEFPELLSAILMS